MPTLTPDQVERLTDRVRKTAQCKVLKELGIPFIIHPDGHPVVLRAAMEASLGHATANQGSTSPSLRVPKARQLLLRQSQ
ncbi:MAG: DUF4224 domain-containing protein [Burkholderiaceae bacterium]|nr:DUF4224 domain-containing protein [Burkholderiaceae bacterium]